jgi:Na+-transporting methylmalonyl-CoA/oxaloacetate decarboxylase gamma subunit
MFFQSTAKSDTMQAVQDTVNQTADTASSAFQKIEFTPQNIFANDGILITVAGYVVVFLSLLLLFVIFTNLTKVLRMNIKKKLQEAGKTEVKEEELSISGETTAAIGMALYLHYQEVHDFENTVITMKRVQKAYSPWSSKIYGLRQFPRK